MIVEPGRERVVGTLGQGKARSSKHKSEAAVPFGPRSFLAHGQPAAKRARKHWKSLMLRTGGAVL